MLCRGRVQRRPLQPATVIAGNILPAAVPRKKPGVRRTPPRAAVPERWVEGGGGVGTDDVSMYLGRVDIGVNGCRLAMRHCCYTNGYSTVTSFGTLERARYAMRGWIAGGFLRVHDYTRAIVATQPCSSKPFAKHVDVQQVVFAFLCPQLASYICSRPALLQVVRMLHVSIYGSLDRIVMSHSDASS